MACVQVVAAASFRRAIPPPAVSASPCTPVDKSGGHSSGLISLTLSAHLPSEYLLSTLLPSLGSPTSQAVPSQSPLLPSQSP